MSPWQSCQEETVALWTQKSPCVLWSTLSWSERYSFQNEKMLPWFYSFLTYFFVKYTYLYFWKLSNSKMDYFVIWGNCSKIVLQGNKNVFKCFQSGFLSTLFLSTHRTIMVAEQDMHHLKKGRPKYLCVEIAHILAYHFYEFNSACREL